MQVGVGLGVIGSAVLLVVCVMAAQLVLRARRRRRAAGDGARARATTRTAPWREARKARTAQVADGAAMELVSAPRSPQRAPEEPPAWVAPASTERLRGIGRAESGEEEDAAAGKKKKKKRREALDHL